MAEGYTSWTCADLGGATIYSSDVINNPDWAGSQGFCPLVHPVGFNIINYFMADIRHAIDTNTDWDSGILSIGRAVDNGEVKNMWFLIQVSVSTANDRLYVRYGYGQNQSSFYNSQLFQVARIGVNFLSEYSKCFYILRLRNRSSFTYENLPGYSGTVNFILIFGFVNIYKGVWQNPNETYPWGRMIYSLLDTGDAATCLLSIPCANNNQQSRMQQSSAVFGIDAVPMTFSIGDGNYNIGDDNGHFDGDPEEPTEPDPNDNDPGGPSGPGGGDGNHRPIYDPIPVPNLPDIGPNSAGFVYMLRLTVAQMQQFAIDLVRPSWWTVIKNFFADPLDFICGIMIVPYQPTSQMNVYPKFGDNVFDHTYPLVHQQYTEIDCGSLEITKYFGSCFDNNPYTELLLWLPYIGYRQLDPDECIGKSVHIKYHCDCLTGDCVCFISTEAGNPPASRVIAQYSGNCGVRVPFGAQSFDAAVAASVALLGGAVGTAITGGAVSAGLVGSEIGASQVANSILGSTVTAVNGSKRTTERSGTAGASAGYLSIQKPHLFRTVPQQSLPENYKELEGYPSNIAGPLSKFSGFAAVEIINLNGLNATKEEIDEIKSLLIGGVYI